MQCEDSRVFVWYGERGNVVMTSLLSVYSVNCELFAFVPNILNLDTPTHQAPHSRGVDQIKAKTLLQKIYILLGELKEHIREKECLLYVCIDSDACISDAWDLLVMNGQTCVIKY